MHTERDLPDQLYRFVQREGVEGKGALAVVLTLTRRMRDLSFPLQADAFVTKGRGQVQGLGRGAVQSILKDHGIDKVLAKEGGRTNRGSMALMQAYVEFCNQLHAAGLWDPSRTEAWWVDRIRSHFLAAPIKLRIDAAKSLRAIITELFDLAFKRQRESHGTMVAGAVLQHLVGAKLRVVLPGESIACQGFSVADAPSRRQGDFLVGDTAIHVTTAPTEALLQKCRANLDQALRPLVITTADGVGGAKGLARNLGIEDRVDVLDIEQFIATNVFEWTSFDASARAASFDTLLDAYNQIISECETDTSLRIERA